MDPKGKVALVTGAANGLGLAISKELLQQGVKGISMCDVDEVQGKKVVEEMCQQYGKDKAIFIRTDVTKEEDQQEAFKKTKLVFGDLDIVVNNAGVYDDKHWRRAVSININGIIQGTILALEHMGTDKGGKGGVVVNTASVAGLGAGLDITPIYNATKHAIIGLSCSFGSEFFFNLTGVRVMAICPGYTDTHFVERKSGESITLYEEWMPEFQKGVLKHSPPQKTESVGKGVLKMIREAENGSLWLSVNDQPVYQIKIPAFETLRI